MAFQGESEAPESDPWFGRSPSPPGPGDKSVAFRTMLKRVGDQLSSQDIRAVAYIYSLPNWEQNPTALGVLSRLHQEGKFSPDNIDPLVELLSRISRHDVATSCGLKEYEQKYCVKTSETSNSPLRGESPVSRDSETKDLHNSARLSFSQQKQIPADTNTTGDTHHDTPSPSPPHSTLPVFEALSPEQTPVLEGPGSHLASLNLLERDPLASLSTHDKTKVVESVLSNVEARSQLMSMLSEKPVTSLTQTAALQRAKQPSRRSASMSDYSESSIPLSIDPSSLGTNSSSYEPRVQVHHMEVQTDLSSLLSPDMSLPMSRKDLPTHDDPSRRSSSTSGFASSPGSITPTPDTSDPRLLSGLQQLSASSSYHDKQGRSSSLNESRKTTTDLAASRQTYRPSRSSDSEPERDTLTWRLSRADLCKPVFRHSIKTFKKELRVRSSGCRSKPVLLKFRLHANGIGHDKDNSVTLEVLVDVTNNSFRQQITNTQLNLTVTILIGEGAEFLSGKEIKHQLTNFCIHDFIPHEVLIRCHDRVVEIKVEAHLTYDDVSYTLPEETMISDKEMNDVVVIEMSQSSVAFHPHN